MENEFSQNSTGLNSASTTTTPTSTGIGIIPTITEALLTAVNVAVQNERLDTDLTDHTRVTRGTINKILRCKNMSNEIEILQIQPDATR